MTTHEKQRCSWAKIGKDGWTGYLEYHDTEWGVPQHDDRHLFEMLILEGAQAGLSWETVLKKHGAYRKAFDNFDVKKVAQYGENKVQELLQNEGIIRNQLKIRSAIRNAKAYIEIQKEFGSFDAYLWAYVDGKPLKNNIKTMADIPVSTTISDALSKDLKKRGMNFVGSTIIYAYMQAVGLVEDHIQTCFKHKG